jgi:hypothetical protein
VERPREPALGDVKIRPKERECQGDADDCGDDGALPIGHALTKAARDGEPAQTQCHHDRGKHPVVAAATGCEYLLLGSEFKRGIGQDVFLEKKVATIVLETVVSEKVCREEEILPQALRPSRPAWDA